MTCRWAYPNDAYRVCGAEATVTVQYRVGGVVTRYCLNHAQREVIGGQARYVDGHE